MAEMGEKYMTKPIYIVLAVTNDIYDLLSGPRCRDKGLPAVLQTLQDHHKVLYFDSLQDAGRYCELANRAKYIHQEILVDAEARANDPLTGMTMTRHEDADANPVYKLSLGNNNFYTLKTHQAYANLAGFQADEVITVREESLLYFGEKSHVIRLCIQNSKDLSQRVYTFNNTKAYQVLAANHPDRNKPAPVEFNPDYTVRTRNDYVALRNDGEYGWQAYLIHAPLHQFVILQAEAKVLTSDKNTWLPREEPKCVMTARQAQVGNLNREQGTHYLTMAENAQLEQALSYRIAYKQHILALSGVIHNFSKGVYVYSAINFEEKYQKLNFVKWFLIKNSPLLLKKFAKHFFGGEKLIADPEELKKSLKWDLNKILKNVKCAEIHGIFKELAHEFGKEHADALISARDTIEQAFMARQANQDFYWELASALTLGLAWLLRKIFFSDPQQAAPVEATFNLNHLRKGMHDFYQSFRNVRHLGYEKRAANVVGAYQDKTHFLKHLRDKQGKLQFNKCGEMGKEIIAIDEAQDQITVRGTDAEIQRWKLMERFGKKDLAKQQARHAAYQQKLETSKTYSREIIEKNNYRPSV